jgi:hypothetical protein
MNPSTLETVKPLKSTEVEANNLYYTRNARMVQTESESIGHTDRMPSTGVKYIVSSKPLSKSDLDEWELEPIYTDS